MATTPINANTILNEVDAKSKSDHIAKDKTFLFAVNTDDCVLFNIPLGQPNLKSVAPKRLTLKKQDGPSCYLNALKRAVFVAEGDKYFDIKDEKVKNERNAISRLRKDLKKLCKFQYLKNYAIEFLSLSEINKPEFTLKLREENPTVTNKHITYFCLLAVFSLLEKSKSRENIEKKISIQELKNIVDKFYQSTHENFIDFVRIYLNNESMKVQIDAHLTFLKSINVDPKIELKNMMEVMTKKVDPFQPSGKSKAELNEPKQGNFGKKVDDEELRKGKFGDFTLIAMAKCLSAIVRKELRRIFEFEYIQWSPSDTIEVLFKLLKEKQEPLVFGGLFGQNFYKPDTLRKFNLYETVELKELAKYGLKGIEFFGWNKSDFIGEDKFKTFDEDGHAITVVGLINSKDNPRVLIWDPQFSSDPSLGANALYTVHYDAFKKRCIKSLEDPGFGLQRKVKTERNASQP